jgi:uncharacterized protein YydD (DUF2326 family)
MVLLKRLYSDTGLFDPIKFEKGINLILGEYTRTKEKRSELNGIGKSTLVRLIDFALLSDTSRKRHFDVKRHRFLNGSTVHLEFEAQGKTFTISRSFAEPNIPTFGTNASNIEIYRDQELRTILGEIFFGQDNYQGYFEKKWFRSLIRFFIKDDITNFERTDPLKFASPHINKYEAYTYNLFLLGLPNKSINQFKELKKQKTELSKQTKRISDRLKEDTGKDISQVNSELRVMDERIKSLENAMREYRFLKTYQSVEKELVSISGQISDFLRRSTLISRRLNEFRNSYEYEIEIDSEKISRIYGEIRQVFGDAVRKTLKDVIGFRQNLAESRARFLQSQEEELSSELQKITDSISSLETRRSELYKILEEKKALDGLKNSYSYLVSEKSKREQLGTSVNQLNDLNNDVVKLNERISVTVTNIFNETRKVESEISQIQTLFLDILNSAIRISNLDEAVFDIRPTPKVSSPFNITVDVPKSEALGKARLKILTYDLTVFFNIIRQQRALPNFLIHDGTFFSIDKKTTISLLNHVYSKFLQNQNMQYIITANEDEIYIPDNMKPLYGDYKFDLNKCTIAKYKDIPSEMIFKREY